MYEILEEPKYFYNIEVLYAKIKIKIGKTLNAFS